jgi:hypothetical protein
MAGGIPPTSVSLCQSDFPKVKFWFKRDWNEYQNEQPTDSDNQAERGRGRAAKGVNVTLRFVELEDGTIISGDRASEMRRFARTIWCFFEKEGTAPATWGAADVETRKKYCHEMRQRFPELSLCDLDWKAEQIATDNYPSWHAGKGKKKIKEEEGKSEERGDTQLQAKRSRKGSVTECSKRARVNQILNCDEKGQEQEVNMDVTSTNLTTVTEATMDSTTAVSRASFDSVC